MNQFLTRQNPRGFLKSSFIAADPADKTKVGEILDSVLVCLACYSANCAIPGLRRAGASMTVVEFSPTRLQPS
jgi:hypothetical protein